MSRLTTGISGAAALVLVSGAAQFAMGNDLTAVAGRLPPISQLPLSSSRTPEAAGVNRTAKTDRAAGPSGSPALLRTIALTPNGVSEMTVVIRVPVVAAAPSSASVPVRPVTRKPMMACEPVVSVLTEVARRLEPGRCVA